MKVKYVAVLLVLLVGWMTTIAYAGQKGNGAIKTGKQGEFTLNQRTRVGDITLEPGNYIFQHRVIGKDHYVRFWKIDVSASFGESYPQPEPTDVGVIKCRMEPVNTKIKSTMIYTEKGPDGPRITKVQVRGENVVHIF